MLPTPAKFHYVFNLRDLSRIWQGMLNSQGDVITSESILLSLWNHETTRVIADRFTEQQDKDWFSKTMLRVAEEELGEDSVDALKDVAYFVDFLRYALISKLDTQTIKNLIRPRDTSSFFRILRTKFLNNVSLRDLYRLPRLWLFNM